MKITDDEFYKLSSFIKAKAGVDLKANKKALVVLRLSRRLEVLELTTFQAYYKYLIEDKDGTELHYFIDQITTHYTFFLRENEQFRFFEQNILPEITSNIFDGDLRIWSAASSTGEEAYTIAMILEDFFGFGKREWNKELLATDIARKVIDKANLGIYTKAEMTGIPDIWLSRYFDKIDETHYQIKAFLRNEIIFRCFNLLEIEYPFKRKFHVIFCRNVLIYFDKETKFEVIRKLKDNLEIGGYLILGLSEAINYRENELTYVQPSIYRKEQ
jgi:chemotaxis protein methyltransferase CheR